MQDAPGQAAERAEKTERLVAWLYDAAGLAVLGVKGQPAALQRDAQGRPLQPYRLQDGSGIEQVIIERGKDQVTVHNALGQVSRASWAQRTVNGQSLRLMERFTGPGCASCALANTAWRYDALGRVPAPRRTSATPTTPAARWWRKAGSMPAASQKPPCAPSTTRKAGSFGTAAVTMAARAATFAMSTPTRRANNRA